MSSKTLAQLITEIATNFPDNSAGAITAALLRTTVGDLAQSSQLLLNDAFIVVRTSADPVANGTALLAAYVATKALTPNGSAIDANNRATLLVPPGTYDFGATPLVMDTEGVNVVGISGHWKSARFVSDGACSITAGNMLLKGIAFRPRGDDTVPGLIITEDLNPLEIDFIECYPPGDGFEVEVTNSGNAIGRFTNSRIDYSLIDGNLQNTAIIDGTQIGTSSPQRGVFGQLTGAATLVTSLLCRPNNSTGDAAAISKIAMCFATLDFGSIAAGASADLTIACAGLTSGDHRSACKVGFLAAGPTPGIIFDAWVSATNQVTVRATNITALPIDPASTDYSVIVFKANPPS